MDKKYQISVYGTGSLGSALIYLIANNKHQIDAYEISNENRNKFYQNIGKNYQNIKIHSELSTMPKNPQIILPCIPSNYIKNFYKNTLPDLPKNTKIISITKGFIPKSIQTISQYLSEKVDPKNILTITGPTFASEIINNYPTQAIIASTNKSNYLLANQLFSNQNFKVSYNQDIVGCELGGIFKNCYAITLGLLARENFQMNTKSLCLIKIIQEISSLYKKIHLKENTIYSLAFLGDLIATGLNPDSRNYQFGLSIDKNKKNTIEGADNIKLALKLADKHKIKLPILLATQKIIEKKITISNLIDKLYFN